MAIMVDHLHLECSELSYPVRTFGPYEDDEATDIDDEDEERGGPMDIIAVRRKILNQLCEVVSHTRKWANDEDDNSNYYEIEEINSGIEKAINDVNGITLPVHSCEQRHWVSCHFKMDQTSRTRFAKQIFFGKKRSDMETGFIEKDINMTNLKDLAGVYKGSNFVGT
ncbi:unnamed protein product [Lepeophtheirus salmonis]|uniref:(salmon louse) hypothetical protein n=1 Tax=Lepeophtheirus salmonis TaxID=72036 RepID=A0A7R8CST0_LEPSM|nr:unnamed protein product [Lepeophtheirus salmonis]CAF2867281.1 unnamed protein product [Lepeophtheirus salmonis]